MNLKLVRTIKNEQVIVNLDYVVFVGEVKGKVIIRFADCDYITCADNFDTILRLFDNVVVGSNALEK